LYIFAAFLLKFSYIFLNSRKFTGISAIFVIYCKKIRKIKGR